MPTRPSSKRAAPARSRAKKDEEPVLQLDNAHAIAILEKAIEYEVIDEGSVPENKRQRINAAAEQIDLMIEAWVKGGINPDSDNEEKAEMGLAVQDILTLAGVEIDEDNEVTYGELPDLDAEPEADEDDGDDDNEGGDGDEAAFDINDIIDGYEDLSAAGRVKAIKKLELDMEEDDDYNDAVSIYEWEEAAEQPSSRVLAYLDSILPQDGEEGEGDEPEDDEPAEDGDEDAGAEDGEEWQQPWTKADGAANDYDKMDAVIVKKHLDKLLAKEELSIEMLDYVRDYETDSGVKAPRKRILDYIEKLRPQVGEGGDEPEEDEDEPEEQPARAARPSAASRSRGGAAKKPEPEPVGDGIILVSVEGEEEPYTCYGIQMAAGAVADALASGATSIQVDAG